MKNLTTQLRPSGFCCRLFTGGKGFIIGLILLLSTPFNSSAQFEEGFDEIAVILNVQRIGSIEIPSVIYKQEIYLPVKDIFDFLKIHCEINNDLDSVSGFFINQQAHYLIDMVNSRIQYENKITLLDKSDFYRTENNLFLKSDYFGSIFGLVCTFNFRDLSVNLTTKIELPGIREMQQALIRKNISQLGGEKKADLTIDRNYSLFKLGTADWMVMNSSSGNGKFNTTASLTLGATIAGGETNVSVNYNSELPIKKSLLNYSWRYVNNDKKLLKQVTAGKIFPQSVTNLQATLLGIQLTNIPTTYRHSFGTYLLSNTTQPGWMVELYINNVLVNYVKADASGFYSFEVPLVYGNSAIKLRFYGLFGEEQTTEKNISIPFNFIPEHKLEYTITGGMIGDNKKNLFSRANLNYGLSKRITIGGGMEYLLLNGSGKAMPYINANMRVGQNLLLSAERMYSVKSSSTLSYRKPSSLQVEFNYVKYDAGQTVITNNYREEKRLIVSMPLRGKKYVLYSRLSVDQITLRESKFTTAELLFSGMFAGISSNFTTYSVITDKNPLVYSSLSANLKLPAGFKLTPMAQFEYRYKNFSLIRAELGRSVMQKGYMNITYEKNLITKRQSFGINLRLNLSFAQTFISAIQNDGRLYSTTSARGSLLYDGYHKKVIATAMTNSGRGALLIVPFLDLNRNGVQDADEPKAEGLKLRINGGRVVNNKDTTMQVLGLEAYNSYFIELDKNNFESVTWTVTNKTISVVIDPNQLKVVKIPVQVMGEVSGMVFIKENDDMQGQARVIVNIFNDKNKQVAKVLSEADGYFSFAGLAPGNYLAAVDEKQLEKLQMAGLPNYIAFTIKKSREGDIAADLKFILKKKGVDGFEKNTNQNK